MLFRSWSRLWGLTFNKNKCTVISLKRQHNATEFLYSMDNTTLTRTNTIMDLGVNINNNLKWNTHIQSITSKANQRLWLIIRTLGYNAPLKSKTITYCTLSRSILEYNTVVWSPSTKDNICMIESVQRKATNFLTNNPCRPSRHHIDYKERLLQCNLLPLSYRREIYDIIFFIKSIRGLVSFNILDYISFQTCNVGRLTRNMGHGLNLNYPITSLESSAHFYPYRIARLWNALPLALRIQLMSPVSLAQIKSILNNHYKDRLIMVFESNNTCTWVTVCRCTLCRY